MATFKERSCNDCNTKYQPTGPAAKYCTSCAEIRAKANYERTWRKHYHDSMRRKGREEFIGAGKGGNVPKGTDSPHWKNGIGIYRKIRQELAKELGYKCERCHCDLDSRNPYKWVCHHIDHNRSNNERYNLEILCKSCHQIEHEAYKNFGTCND